MERPSSPPSPIRLLVIGYGNTLRCDDGAGVRVAEAVGAWDRPGVRAKAVQQLVPELAEDLRLASTVVFVDARLAAEGEDLVISPLEPAPSAQAAGHSSDPRSLLLLTRWLHGRSPDARLLAIPGLDFSIGEVISPTARKGIGRALAEIAALADAVDEPQKCDRPDGPGDSGRDGGSDHPATPARPPL